MDNIYVTSGTTALVVSVLLQLVKNSPYVPGINRQTGKLNAAVSAVAALLSALGISYSFDFDPDTGRFAAGFSGSLADMLHGIGHWIVQWSEQHILYKGLIVPAEVLGEIRGLLRERFGKPLQTK